MRRILISLSTMVAAAVAMALSTPAAFAIRAIPPSGGTVSPTRAALLVHSHSGLASWELALIAIGAALFLVAATSVVVVSRRRVMHPAAV